MLGAAWKASVHLDAEFDEWDAAAREVLPALWAVVETAEDLTQPVHAVGAQSWVFHAGWSVSRQRMVAYEYASDDGFAGRDVTDQRFLSSPAPLAPPERPPSSKGAWLAYADELFNNRALAPVNSGHKCVFGDDLILTRIERGTVTQERIGHIATDDLRFRQALTGTCHPLGQLGPCHCGSGGPFAVCCPHLLNPHTPCPCHSGRTFGECHWVDPESLQALEHWTRPLAGEFPEPLNLRLIRQRAREINEHWSTNKPAPTTT
jgi:hypothetical protein